MVNQNSSTAASQRWLQILAEPLPKAAILISNDRNEIMPLWYYQYVEGRRADLLGLFPLIVTDPAYANVGRVLDQALASRRPVYLIKPMAGLGLKADLTQTGSLFRATPSPVSPTHPLDISLPAITTQAGITETIKLIGYDLSPATIRPGAVVTLTLYWQAVQNLSVDYTSYVHLVDSNEQGVTQSDHQPGGDFYPSSLWQIGEVLRDQHTLTLPGDMPGGLYHLQAGLYYQPEPGVIAGMGGGVEIGLVTIKSLSAGVGGPSGCRPAPESKISSPAFVFERFYALEPGIWYNGLSSNELQAF